MNDYVNGLIRRLKPYTFKTHKITRTAIQSNSNNVIETVKKELYLTTFPMSSEVMYPNPPLWEAEEDEEDLEDITTIILRADYDIGVVSKLQIWKPMAKNVIDPFKMGYHSFIVPIHDGLERKTNIIHRPVMGLSRYIEYNTKYMDKNIFIHSLDCTEPYYIENRSPYSTDGVITYSLNIKCDESLLKKQMRLNTYAKIDSRRNRIETFGDYFNRCEHIIKEVNVNKDD